MITFFKSVIKELRAKVEAATGNPIGPYRMGLDANTTFGYYLVGSATSNPTGNTTTLISANSHGAITGDILQFDSGVLDKQHTYVQSVTTNTITLSQSLSNVPTSTFFYILRPSFATVTTSHALNNNIFTIGGTAQTAGFDFGAFLQPDGLVQGVNVVPTGIWSSSNSQWIAWDGSASVTGTVSINPAINGVPTTVAASATSVTVLAANNNRKGAIIRNDSTANLYLRLSSGSAVLNQEAVKLLADDVLVLENGDYTQIISGIWSAATGNARVLELT